MNRLEFFPSRTNMRHELYFLRGDLHDPGLRIYSLKLRKNLPNILKLFPYTHQSVHIECLNSIVVTTCFIIIMIVAPVQHVGPFLLQTTPGICYNKISYFHFCDSTL